MKLAKIFWSFGSILVNITIGIYVYLQSNGPSDLKERFEYVNTNWSIYSGHWKAEYLIMTLILIAAIYFAVHLKSISWTILSVGQFIILLTYPIMLGGYPNTPFEIANMANQMATITFIFGNLIFGIGLLHLYYNSKVMKPVLRYTAVFLSGFMVIVFLLVFIGVTTWKQSMIVAPLINVLYLINAYYGWQMKEGE